MELISLSKLVNKYPTIGNYVAKVAGSIKLNGIYPLKNFIDFKISPVNNIKLDDIQSVDNTKIQFVLGIKNKPSEITPFKYFTSPDFFKKLQDSVNEPNPYFILQALKKEFIVEYSLEADIDILKDLSKLEKDDNVKVKNHLWFLENGNVDYKKLVQYIDWVVSTPKVLDTENLGVIPVSEMLTKADFEIEKLKLKELPKSQKTADGGGRGAGAGAGGSQDDGDTGGEPDVGVGSGSGSGAGSGGGQGDGGGGGASGAGSSFNPGQADGQNSGYGGRPGDFSSGNANYTGNQFEQQNRG